MVWWQRKPLIDVIEAFERVSEREQKIVMATASIVIFMMFFMLVIEPNILQANSDKEAYVSVTDINEKVERQIKATLDSKYEDPNDALRKALKRLKEKEVLLDTRISALTKALVDPKNMVYILKSVLSESKGIELISLENLPSEDIYFSNDKSVEEDKKNTIDDLLESEKSTDNNAGIIYKHALEVVVEADFQSMIDYLERLDQIEWKVFWQDLSYEVKEYPKGQLKIKIYTLSTSQEVLGV